MPKWSEYKQHAKERGALALELYVAQSTPVAAPEAVRAVLADHLAYQRSLEEAGHLAFAGPVSDASGEMMEGAGMIVYRAASLDQARELAAADPMHSQGVRSFTLVRWLINEGSFTLSVGLSTGRVALS
jgi:uncharacterized protein